MIDPAVIYADKSHSMNRGDVIEHVRSGKPGPIPSLNVLHTMLSEEMIDVRAFLQDIDANGLPDDHLAIGLRCKERELKGVGDSSL